MPSHQAPTLAIHENDPSITDDERRLMQEVCDRFDTAEVAQQYRARKNVMTRRNLREWRCIEQALHDVTSGATVLDLPCGSGRLEPLLEARGYRVTAADSSSYMLDQATESYLAASGNSRLPDHMRFLQQNVMQTTFEDGEFDAVICNRLLHHFPTPDLRRKALAELARISKGPVVISYFTNFAFSALRFHLKNLLTRRRPTDRVPIWFRILQQDLAAAGLRCTGTYSVRRGLSPQTYLRLEKV
jgi:ubiquinone/menaquinone biosynthesis C-methylase UbiE